MWGDIHNFFSQVLPSRIEISTVGLSSAIVAVFEFALGPLTLPLYWLGIFVTVDYLTGNWKAIKSGTWCSREAYKGAVKKFFVFATVAMSHGLDVVCGTNFLESGAIIAFSLSETGSLIENIDGLGYGGCIPASIRQGLKVFQEKQIKKIEGKMK